MVKCTGANRVVKSVGFGSLGHFRDVTIARDYGSSLLNSSSDENRCSLMVQMRAAHEYGMRRTVREVRLYSEPAFSFRSSEWLKSMSNAEVFRGSSLDLVEY